jgi:glycine betaine catabolism A
MITPTGSSAARLDQLIAQRQPGWSLPRDFYVAADLFELDLDRIYRRHWLLAGPVCRIPQPGDYFTCEVGPDSLIFVREDSGEIRGFHNVCRHRGSRICLDAEGHTKRFVCPYHNWSYLLSGDLAHARHLPENVPTGDLGLHPFAVRVVAGLIFFCLSEQPPEFSTTAEDVDRFFSLHQLDRTRVARRTTEIIHANWKVVAENFWECYHCGPTHPEFCGVMSYAHAQNNTRLAAERAEFEHTWTLETTARGGVSGTVPLAPPALHQGGRVPIRPGFLTQSRDGHPVAPLLGEATEYDGAVTSFMHYPLLWYLVCNDHALLTRFTPKSPLETELELTWLVAETAVEGRDYTADEVAWLWSVTAAQDKTICENNQLGILSSRYQPGPYVTTESSVDGFVSWYLHELSRTS